MMMKYIIYLWVAGGDWLCRGVEGGCPNSDIDIVITLLRITTKLYFSQQVLSYG